MGFWPDVTLSGTPWSVISHDNKWFNHDSWRESFTPLGSFSQLHQKAMNAMKTLHVFIKHIYNNNNSCQKVNNIYKNKTSKHLWFHLHWIHRKYCIFISNINDNSLYVLWGFWIFEVGLTVFNPKWFFNVFFVTAIIVMKTFNLSPSSKEILLPS